MSEHIRIIPLEAWHQNGMAMLSVSLIISEDAFPEAEYDADGDALNVYDASFVRSPFGWCWHDRPKLACSAELFDALNRQKNYIADMLWSDETAEYTLNA